MMSARVVLVRKVKEVVPTVVITVSRIMDVPLADAARAALAVLIAVVELLRAVFAVPDILLAVVVAASAAD